jgi:hypothetical protein
VALSKVFQAFRNVVQVNRDEVVRRRGTRNEIVLFDEREVVFEKTYESVFKIQNQFLQTALHARVDCFVSFGEVHSFCNFEHFIDESFVNVHCHLFDF